MQGEEWEGTGEDGKGVRLNVEGDGEDACVRAVPVRALLCLALPCCHNITSLR